MPRAGRSADRNRLSSNRGAQTPAQSLIPFVPVPVPDAPESSLRMGPFSTRLRENGNEEHGCVGNGYEYENDLGLNELAYP